MSDLHNEVFVPDDNMLSPGSDKNGDFNRERDAFVLGRAEPSPFFYQSNTATTRSVKAPRDISFDDISVPLEEDVDSRIEEITHEYIEKLDELGKTVPIPRNRLFGRAIKHYSDFDVRRRPDPTSFQNFCSILAHRVPKHEHVKERGWGITWQSEQWNQLSDNEKDRWKDPKKLFADLDSQDETLARDSSARRKLASFVAKQQKRAVQKHCEAVEELEKMGLEVMTFVVDTNLKGEHDFTEVLGSPRGHKYAKMLLSKSLGIKTFQSVAATTKLLGQFPKETDLYNNEVEFAERTVELPEAITTPRPLTNDMPCVGREGLRAKVRGKLLDAMRKACPALSGRERLPAVKWSKTMQKHSLELQILIPELSDGEKEELRQQLQSISHSQKQKDMGVERLTFIYKALLDKTIRFQRTSKE